LKNPLKKLIIAIDGPVGSGKSTLARRVAQMLGYVYVDTGAMYRALALKALRRGLAFDGNDEKLVLLARETRIDLRAEGATQRVFLDHEDVTTAIRTPEVSQAASRIAVNPGVRHVLVAEQRRAGEQGGVVMEGRDIGSVVFPDANISRRATRLTCGARSKKYVNATAGIKGGQPRHWFARPTQWWWIARPWNRKKWRVSL
jgi:cytidylate kinase